MSIGVQQKKNHPCTRGISPLTIQCTSWQSISPVLVGVGKTVLKYFASEDGMLSFANNKPVKIFSKGAGSNPDLWGVMVSSILIKAYL